jgi:hypothetical protein
MSQWSAMRARFGEEIRSPRGRDRRIAREPDAARTFGLCRIAS